VRKALKLSASALIVAGALAPRPALGQNRPTAVAATTATPGELRAWDAQVDQMIRSRDLQVREVKTDTMVPGRRHERLDQFVRGVRIVGGDLTRQTANDGTVSVLGILHTNVDVDLTPALSRDDARGAIDRAVSGESFGDAPELVVLPLSDGYHLAYYGQSVAGHEIINVYVDAKSGAALQQYSDYQREIGSGRGTYGDNKKVSTKPMSGAFVTDDPMRPGAITTYDMKGNLARTEAILNRQVVAAPSDIGSDTDNVWTDPIVVDAHAYGGWYYDYLFRRFGRHGIDDRELRMAIFTHPVRLQDYASAPPDVRGLYYINAFFCSTCGPDGRGAVVFGEGLPPNAVPGVDVKPFSAALDVVGHELTHAVVASSARLNGFPFSEAGALNEALADVFGVSTAFFYEPAGSAPLNASYMQGRDLTSPSGLLGRSMSNPAQTGDPDHYSQRNIGGDPHYNGVILTHAFYLAIEGGTNRTSGISVQGVGALNRELIEKVFFRALTTMMPSSSTFALTRAATIQAARDLYGSGSIPERAVTQAWDAVGVQPRTSVTAAVLPNPATGTNNLCAGERPSWTLGLTVSAGSSTLRVTQLQLDQYDSGGRLIDRATFTPQIFAQFFTSCGPGSSTILAQTDACSAVCTSLGDGRSSGEIQMTVTALDEAGRTVSATTPRTALRPPQ
jgi:Zn-dependent metalloprotease